MGMESVSAISWYDISPTDTLADEGLPVPTIMKRLGHCSLDVTLAYLRGREAEGEQEQNFANQSALALYA
jgi:hypothetical protein